MAETDRLTWWPMVYVYWRPDQWSRTAFMWTFRGFAPPQSITTCLTLGFLKYCWYLGSRCPHVHTIACGFGFVKISGTWSLDLEMKSSCQVIGVGSTAFNYPFIPDMWQYAIHLPLDMLLIFCKSSLTGITFLNQSLVQFFNFLFMLLSKAPPYSRLGGGNQ